MIICVSNSLFYIRERQMIERLKGNKSVIKPGHNKQGWRLIECL